MNTGGLFLGKAMPPRGDEDPRRVVRQYGIVWGRAVRDADDVTRKKRNVSFLIAYDREPNPNYGRLDERGRPEKMFRPLCLNCLVSGKNANAEVLAAVERGDAVLCVGRVTSKLQNTKKRGKMWFRQMKVEVCIPATLIELLFKIASSKKIMGILEEENNEESDVWED